MLPQYAAFPQNYSLSYAIPDVVNLSSKFEHCVVFSFLLNSTYGTDGTAGVTRNVA